MNFVEIEILFAPESLLFIENSSLFREKWIDIQFWYFVWVEIFWREILKTCSTSEHGSPVSLNRGISIDCGIPELGNRFSLLLHK